MARVPPGQSRVAVVGPGAVGATVAAHLAAAARHQLVVCARSPLDELVITTASGELRAAARVATRPADAGSADWVLVATKAHQTEGAAEWLAHFSAGGATVAVLQNGV